MGSLFFYFIFLSFFSFFSLDRCSIPSREVSILWSYLDIRFSFSYYVYLNVLFLVINYLFKVLRLLCPNLTDASSRFLMASQDYLFEPGGYSLRNQAKGMLEVLRLAVPM